MSGLQFNELGYTFTKQGPHVEFKDKDTRRVIAEADYFLEDGQYAMAVEVKTELNESDVDDHVERIGVIRRYFDERGDKRILVGAVAGGIVRKFGIAKRSGCIFSFTETSSCPCRLLLCHQQLDIATRVP